MIEGFYDKIDALITDSIRKGENPLQNQLCIAESVLLSNALGMREGDSFRVIDRRLQYLRKKRKIEHIRKDAALSRGKVAGWNVID